MKSLFLAYLCWFCGGLFGLHHLYLGRDIHAFLTLSTFGGYFTLGLIRDLWRLPDYVNEANQNKDYLDDLKYLMNKHKSPPSSWARHFAYMIVGNLFALLVSYATPYSLLGPDLSLYLQYMIIPFASALGVWCVGNVGPQEGRFKYPLIAAYLSLIPSYFFKLPAETLTTLFSMIAFNWYSKKWRPRGAKKSKPFIVRLLIISVCLAIYSSLWYSWLYYNCTVEDADNNEISCREALNNFFTSTAYKNLSQAIWTLYEHGRHNGFLSLWKEFVDEFDISGKTNALATLGLDASASTEQIVARYKKLSRQFHPDKEIDMTKKADKQEKFIQVQEAYKKLVPSRHQ